MWDLQEVQSQFAESEITQQGSLIRGGPNCWQSPQFPEILHLPPRTRLSTDHDISVIRLGRTLAVAVTANPNRRWNIVEGNFPPSHFLEAAPQLSSGWSGGLSEGLWEANSSNEIWQIISPQSSRWVVISTPSLLEKEIVLSPPSS